MTSSAATDRIGLRAAVPGDRDAVLALLRKALGRPDDRRFEALHIWKHELNPFGPSYEWVAVEGTDIVGYRAFLHWEFTDGTRTFRAIRAVDTATDPVWEGKGIFTRLTLHGLEAAAADQIDFVFNTPNDKSRPGYLRMGWDLVGVLRPRARPRSPLAMPSILRGRVPAGHWGEASSVGQRAEEAFADDAGTAQLVKASSQADGRLRTPRSAPYLRWRYGGDLLGYRVMPVGRDIAEGAACFRLRRRGSALEATIGDLLVPREGASARRHLIRKVLKDTRAHYALVLDGSRRDGTLAVPGQGPTLTWRSIRETSTPPLAHWALSMGDVELF